MNFTDLETILLMAVPILLWRIAVIRNQADNSQRTAETCARCLISVGKGEGTVIQKDDGTWAYKPNGTNQ